MCLSVVGELISCDDCIANVNIMGVVRQISVELIAHPSAGDHVLIHAGCAIATLSQEERTEIDEALALYGGAHGY